MYRLNDTYLLADNKLCEQMICCHHTALLPVPAGLFRALLSSAAGYFLHPLSQQAPSRDSTPNCSQLCFHSRQSGQRRCEKSRQTPVKMLSRLLDCSPSYESIEVTFASPLLGIRSSSPLVKIPTTNGGVQSEMIEILLSTG